MLFCDARQPDGCVSSSRVDIIKTYRPILTIWARVLFGRVGGGMLYLYTVDDVVSLDVCLEMYMYILSNNIYI